MMAEAWLTGLRKILYDEAKRSPDLRALSLASFIWDRRNLELAFHRVSHNRGRNTPGVDGMTCAWILESAGGVKGFLDEIEHDLHSGNYQPLAVRRKFIPKPGKPGQTRSLGIPCIRDRVLQAAILQIIEPLFEAGFADTSVGFRPGRGVGNGVSLLCRAMKRDHRYQYAIELDIRACFDHIGHKPLLERFKRRVFDPQVVSWIEAFLKAGAIDLSGGDHEGRFIPTTAGVPQGGLVSPLLSNVALSLMDEHYAGREQFYCVRYADDAVVLCQGDEASATHERQVLGELLKRELDLELSEEKTHVTRIQSEGESFQFLGYAFKIGQNRSTRVLISDEKRLKMEREIHRIFESYETRQSLEAVFSELNPILRGWTEFYKRCANSHRAFYEIDQRVYRLTRRWLRRKHPRISDPTLYTWYAHEDGGWADGVERLFRMQQAYDCF